jgi:hypothetical protein
MTISMRPPEVVQLYNSRDAMEEARGEGVYESRRSMQRVGLSYSVMCSGCRLWAVGHCPPPGASGGALEGETVEEIEGGLDMLAAVGTPRTPFFRWRPQLPDPEDDMVLELAVNGHADAIVTVNIRHFVPAAGTFGIEVLRPGALLRRLCA